MSLSEEALKTALEEVSAILNMQLVVDLNSGHIEGEGVVPLAILDRVKLYVPAKIVTSYIDEGSGGLGVIVRVGSSLYLGLVYQSSSARLVLTVMDYTDGAGDALHRDTLTKNNVYTWTAFEKGAGSRFLKTVSRSLFDKEWQAHTDPRGRGPTTKPDSVLAASYTPPVIH